MVPFAEVKRNYQLHPGCQDWIASGLISIRLSIKISARG